MALAFLQAEIDAPRYRNAYTQALEQIRGTRQVLIDNADPSDSDQNNARAYLLSVVRGYKQNHTLFAQFPGDVVWQRCTFDLHELGEFLYANFRTLLELSKGKRLVREGAANFLAGAQGLSKEAQEMIAGIPPIIEGISAGRRYPELIAVTDANSPIVLLEGHTRATAYVIAGAPQAVSVLIGNSAHMRDWWLF